MSSDVVDGHDDRQRVRRHVVPLGLVVPQVDPAGAQVLIGRAGLAQRGDDRRRPLSGPPHRPLGRRAPCLHADRQRGPVRAHIDARRAGHRHRALLFTAHPPSVPRVTHPSVRARPSVDGRYGRARTLGCAPALGSVGMVAGRPVSSPGSLFEGSPSMPTYTPKASEIERAWHVVDADGLVLGRMCTEVARVLRGKHKPTFAPHLDTGDHVVIINATQGRAHGRARPIASGSTATAATRAASSRTPTPSSSPASRPTPSAAPSRACCRRARSAARC